MKKITKYISGPLIGQEHYDTPDSSEIKVKTFAQATEAHGPGANF
jgi:hypothetical protein